MLISSETIHSSVNETVHGAAHSERISIYGPEGFRKFKRHHSVGDFQPIYGTFAMITKNGQQIRISTDHFGLFRLYCYRSGDVWAISDCVSVLMRFAKERGLQLSPYAPSAYAFLLGQGVGQQLSSFRTTISEIELVPHWCDIVIEEQALKFERQPDINWSADLHQTNHDAGLFFASLLNSFIESGMQPFIRMSAGLDSRCTFAAMTSTMDQKKLENVGVQTSPAEKFRHEQKIVMEITKNLPFRELEKVPTAGGTDWKRFKRLHSGVQSHLGNYLDYGPPYPAFSGASGELVRPFYNWGNVDGIKMHSDIPHMVQNQISEDIHCAINQFDGQCKEHHTDENIHYQSFRNRFHFGRSITESIFKYPPLIFSLLSAGTGEGNTDPIHRMIFELGGQDLFEHRYDEPEKAFNETRPTGWQQIKFSESDLFDRELYWGSGGDQAIASLKNPKQEPTSTRTPRTRFVTSDFVQDCTSAIETVEKKGLLTQSVMTGAKKQLQRLEQNGDRALPGTYPSLMAVYSMSMAD